MPVAAAAAIPIPIPNSPIFSPSAMVSPLLCKPSTSSPLTLNLHHGSSSPSSTPSNSSSSPACLLSPLTLPLHSPLNDGLLRFSSSTSPTLLNRKRPARINIPTPSLSFPTAVVDGSLNEVEFQGDGYFVYCKRGKRAAMEDRYSALVNLLGDSKQAFFGVFDGHGGGKAAEFVANNLDRNIMKEVMSICEEEIIEAVKDGYLSTDAKFLKEDLSGGTCSVTAMIRNGNLVVSNAGDCRAVLSRGGVAEALTDDHRPSRKDERDRIENQGGYVDCCNGIWRIQGSLAVSRAFADRHLKQWVVAEPETTLLRTTPECKFLILASDGLWDKMRRGNHRGVKDGYLSTDAEFLKEDSNGGICSVTALIRNGNLVVSNAGDCRAVLSREGVAEALTDDHRPSRKDERDRIENQGGYVDCCNGVWRIQGSLAVSRAFGDRHLKQWVVAEPGTTLLRITPECEFLILASDGLWDKVSIQEAVDVARPSSIGVDKSKSISACKRLVNLSVMRGSIDFLSVMVILLAHFLP